VLSLNNIRYPLCRRMFIRFTGCPYRQSLM
jgi:hypothetical protein